MESIQSFESLGLAEPLLRALRDRQYTTPTPIQAKAIPPLLEGLDLMGSAQTGTGKTAAFTLPILHRMAAAPKRPAPQQFRTLVLTPTRELAVQVAESFREYGKHQRLSIALVYGGVGAGPQIRALERGLDILVATPGRLLDLFGQRRLKFSGTEFLVLDEADRMLDMGFIHDIRKIVTQLPKQRQSLFFSATFPQTVDGLAREILRSPTVVRVDPQVTTAESVDHQLCFLQQQNKQALLDALLSDQEERDGRQLTLVFSRTKHGADRLVKQLGHSGFKAEAIHGNKSQNVRQRTLDNFRKGKSRVLVATDVAARGIDVKDITLVVNFDMPVEPEAYIHRIGRTARAGAKGRALSFCTRADLAELRAIEALIRQEVDVFTGHEFHDPGIAAQRGRPSRQSGPRSPSFRSPQRPNRRGPGRSQRGRAGVGPR